MNEKLDSFIKDMMLAVALFVVADTIVSLYRWSSRGIIKIAWKLIKRFIFKC